MKRFHRQDSSAVRTFPSPSVLREADTGSARAQLLPGPAVVAEQRGELPPRVTGQPAPCQTPPRTGGLAKRTDYSAPALLLRSPSGAHGRFSPKDKTKEIRCSLCLEYFHGACITHTRVYTYVDRWVLLFCSVTVTSAFIFPGTQTGHRAWPVPRLKCAPGPWVRMSPEPHENARHLTTTTSEGSEQGAGQCSRTPNHLWASPCFSVKTPRTEVGRGYGCCWSDAAPPTAERAGRVCPSPRPSPRGWRPSERLSSVTRDAASPVRKSPLI